MEKYLSKKTEEKIDNLINYIKSTDEYKKVIEIRKQIKQDKELLDLIENVKEKQKQYIRSNKQEELKEQLENLMIDLEENSLYFEYNKNLQEVNLLLETVKYELNNYFTNVTNILK